MEEIIQQFADAIFKLKNAKIVIPDSIVMNASKQETEIIKHLIDIAILRQIIITSYKDPLTDDITIITKLPTIEYGGIIYDKRCTS
jgi:hypothetical protein